MLLTVEKREFLLDVIDIVNSLGKPEENISLLGRDGNAKVYEDKLIRATSVNNHSQFELIRKSNNSPIIYVENEVAIYFGRDFIYLREHVDKLLKQIKEDKDENIG